MDFELKNHFIKQWEKYFPNAELPVLFYYTDEVKEEDLKNSRSESRCLIGNLMRVRHGETFIYTQNSPGCMGGKRYTGFTQKLRKDFEYFLSCGIEGKMQGERYKMSPGLVEEIMKTQPPFIAPGKYLVFKRWDKLTETDEPSASIFFAKPDVLSGLFTLANYDLADLNGVISPMGSGCSSIIQHALKELKSDSPRCILGMFDVSARPYLPADMLTLTVPMSRFVKMVSYMDESFLITESWKTVMRRMAGKVKV
ncbi:MAG: DUF169 domain-containing protein [Ignavibacteria bacterium]|nr:DUF169 domain-containing protein [Ignavibacteria bacterium]MCU7501751.1 DUF169 domain-containing protein [Ignavibacteria bacterium]MCU7516842.1 DUF169 domain-containing protein [Ignavibacteria bacterium]